MNLFAGPTKNDITEIHKIMTSLSMGFFISFFIITGVFLMISFISWNINIIGNIKNTVGFWTIFRLYIVTGVLLSIPIYWTK